MSRWVSFFVLVAVIVVIAAFFLRVMAEFLVPLFVASLLVVVFRPVHLWIQSKLPKRPAIAALITTLTVVLAVVLPCSALFVLAAAEGNEIVKRFDQAYISRKVNDFRTSVNLQIPNAKSLDKVESLLSELRSGHSTDNDIGVTRMFAANGRSNRENELGSILAESKSLGRAVAEEWPVQVIDRLRKQTDDHRAKDSQSPPSTVKEPNGEGNDESADQEEMDPEARFVQALSEERETAQNSITQLWFDFVYQLRDTKDFLRASNWDPEQTPALDQAKLEREFQQLADGCLDRFRDFKINLLGGTVPTFFKEMVNPKPADLDSYTESILGFIKGNVLSWGGTATFFLGRMLFGGMIVVIAIYFFLLDGPGMMKTIMLLSPMEDRHEKELIDEFEKVSRAVVVATLAAAIVQGILAGIGFYFAGVDSVFLLMLLTMVLAMIPFFGAASVWAPVCLYLLLLENNTGSALGLAIYSMLIVSSADNIIKPYILHGQSNLHPLLALLSVLGGVTALCPIGILVGPMLVAFLQTLLKILRDELVTLDLQSEQQRRPQGPDQVTAATTEATLPAATTPNASFAAMAKTSADAQPPARSSSKKSRKNKKN